MSFFGKRRDRKAVGDARGIVSHVRSPSPLAPGLTRADLAAEMAALLPLAAAEPPPEPPPKKSGVSADTIWQFWWQGESAVSPPVRVCLDSVRRHAGGRPVVLIDSANVSEYLDIPPVLLARQSAGGVSVVALSDYIRLALLSLYGGTWIDPTVWISGEIPSETLDSEFFVFASPYWIQCPPRTLSPQLLGALRFMSDRPSSTLFGSCWWMSARPGALPPRVAKRLMTAYWERHDASIDYMLPYDLMSLGFLANAGCQEVWERMPKRPTTDAQLLLGVLLEPYDKGLEDAIFARTAIHKLTHKYPPEIIGPDMFYRRIFESDQPEDRRSRDTYGN